MEILEDNVSHSRKETAECSLSKDEVASEEYKGFMNVVRNSY